MRYNITKSDAFPLVQITLKKNEEIYIESDAMVYHTHGVELIGERSGNTIFSSINRATFNGDIFSCIRARALMDNQQIALSPNGIGRVFILNIGENQYLLNEGAFLASDTTVNIEVVNHKVNNSVVMKTSGEGDLVVNAFGDVQKILLDGTQPLFVNDNHVLCWEETLNCEIITNGKNGEGILKKFSGTGKIFLQTRHVQSLAEILIPFITNDETNEGYSVN